MSGKSENHRREIVRLSVAAALIAAYGVIGAFFHAVLRAQVVYAHFAYIPIVLAGLWWGRRGIVVALILAAMIIGFHFSFGVAGEIWSDLARAGFFLIVGFCVGALRDRLTAAEHAQRATEDRYHRLIEESVAGIFVYRDERVVFANSRFGAMLGYDPPEMIGKPVWDFIHEEDHPKLRHLEWTRRADGFTHLQYECRLVGRDGRSFWAELACSLTTAEGKPAVFVYVHDISARKAAEVRRRELEDLARRQQDQLVHSTRLAELGEMAAAVAHELNQPLTGIRNFARNALFMLENHTGNIEEVKENLRQVSAQVDRAARIISQMRSLARQSERQFVLLDINTPVRESVEFLMPQMQLHGVEVTLDLAENLPRVLGDRVRLEQVFLNLLTNARQAMEESPQRRLHVRTSFAEGSELPIVIEVADTGRGFSATEARKLFTPFFSTKRPGQGTGLGLSISLSIVKEHGGTITAEGAPGQGARFTVRLPAYRPEDTDRRLAEMQAL